MMRLYSNKAVDLNHGIHEGPQAAETGSSDDGPAGRTWFQLYLRYIYFGRAYTTSKMVFRMGTWLRYLL